MLASYFVQPFQHLANRLRLGSDCIFREVEEMATLTIIVGLAGSGKSYLTKEIAAKNNIPAFDDFLARNLIPRATESQGFCSVLVNLQRGYDCVANEVCLVHEDKRAALEKLLHSIFEDTVTVQWIFFENNPEQCKVNVRADKVKPDPEGRVKGIEHYTKDYVIPKGADVRAVGHA
jgi:hypothetical protein